MNGIQLRSRNVRSSWYGAERAAISCTQDEVCRDSNVTHRWSEESSRRGPDTTPRSLRSRRCTSHTRCGRSRTDTQHHPSSMRILQCWLARRDTRNPCPSPCSTKRCSGLQGMFGQPYLDHSGLSRSLTNLTEDACVCLRTLTREILIQVRTPAAVVTRHTSTLVRHYNNIGDGRTNIAGTG